MVYLFYELSSSSDANGFAETKSLYLQRKEGTGTGKHHMIIQSRNIRQDIDLGTHSMSSENDNDSYSRPQKGEMHVLNKLRSFQI